MNNNESKVIFVEFDIDNGIVNFDKNVNEINLVFYRSSYELEIILIFDLCVFFEIVIFKFVILRVSVFWYLLKRD